VVDVIVRKQAFTYVEKEVRCASLRDRLSRCLDP